MDVFRLNLPVLLCFLSLRFASAISNNTVDSSREDVIVYSPIQQWSRNGSGSNVSLPDPQLVQNGTWQFTSTQSADNTSSNANLTFSFNGSAVYVYGILQKGILTAVDFSINGTQVGSYFNTPEIQSPFLYNTSIYANSSLPQGEHIFSASLSTSDPSVFFFDYLIYSSESEDPSSLGGANSAHGLEHLKSTPTQVWTSTPSSSSLQVTTFGKTQQLTSLASITTSVSSSSPPSAQPRTTSSLSIGTPTRVTSLATSSSLPSRHLAVIIGATAGGGVLILAVILLFIAICFIRRRKRATKFKLDPFVTPDPTPAASPDYQDGVFKLPTSVPRNNQLSQVDSLAFQTKSQSAASDVTLTDEIFPLPSEVEDVYGQLEALSVEVQRFKDTEDLPPEQPSRLHRTPTRDVQANFKQLHMEIQRLRHRSRTPSSSGTRTVRADPMTMLHELDLLRAELHDILVERTSDEVSIERLPSYHSRKAATIHLSEEPEVPPPLPTLYVRSEGV